MMFKQVEYDLSKRREQGWLPSLAPFRN